MKLVFAGTPKVAVPSLKALVKAGHDVLAVLTRPDAAVGRSKRLVPSPVAVAAQELGIEVIRPVKLSEPDVLARLDALAPEVCPVVAYGALVPQRALDIPTYGWVNTHFSLLPQWRGAAPVQRGLMAGEETFGITTFELVKALDAGPIFRQLRVPALLDEVAGEALERLSILGAELLVQTLADIAAGVRPTPQLDFDGPYAAKLTPEEVQIDWSNSAKSIVNLVRGASPEPGAWTTFRGERFKILRAHVASDVVSVEPGVLQATRKTLVVGTVCGQVVLDEVQAFGKKVIRGADWARGASLQLGERLV